MQSKTVGGIELHYLAVCERKLWFYSRGITMEHESDRVMEGKILHEESYKRIKEREFLIDNAFKIDLIDGEYLREVKISSKMKKADRLQMLFYLYQLDLRNIKKKGLISYPKEKRTEEILLGENEKKEIKKAIADAYKVINLTKPPQLKKLPYCKKCAYYSLCYAEMIEDDA